MHLASKCLQFLLLLSLCQFSYQNTSAQMRQVHIDNLTPDNEVLRSSFFSPSKGYVAFRDWMGYTSDSGHSFIKKPVTTGNVDFNGYPVNLTFGFGINGVKAFSPDTLIVYGEYGFVSSILYSINGGNSFKLVYHSQLNTAVLSGITDLVFPQNNNTGYALDADRILKTIDKGRSWQIINTETAKYYEHLEAVDNNNVYAFSSKFSTNRLKKTTNGGISWQQVNVPAGQLISYTFFLTANKGWLSTIDLNDNSGNVYYTANGGVSWAKKNNSEVSPIYLTKIKFINDSTGFALSGQFEVSKTTDSGRIWERLPRTSQFSHPAYAHNDLQLWNDNQFWAGGGHGVLELTTNGGGVPLPLSLFRADTANYYQTGKVQLTNFSKPRYQFSWIVNGVPAGSTYNSSYVHDPSSLQDSVMLIATFGTYSDTAIKYISFSPAVVVSSFSPTSGAPGTVVMVTGQNFTGTTQVLFGGTAGTNVKVLSPTRVSATVGSGSSGKVTVITPTGSGALDGFVYIAAPVITSFAPATAPAATRVTITGSNFVNVTGVDFGGVAASLYTIVSANTITAVVGVGASGSVSVKTSSGTSSLPGFTIVPVLASFSPTSGTFGTYITIKGSGLKGINNVEIGGSPAASFMKDSDTSITAIVGTGATGTITATAPGGSAHIDGFTYFDPPKVTSFSPASGMAGSVVVIKGHNFKADAAGNTVYFGAAKATVVSASATSLSVSVPVGATFQRLSVTSNNLTAYSDIPFIVSFPNGGAITPNSFINRTDINLGPALTPFKTLIGDIDGDGKTDLVVSNRGVSAAQTVVSVRRNTSTIANASFANSVNFPVPDLLASALADMDGDGKLDMIVTDGDNARIYLYINKSSPGTISFASPQIITIPTSCELLLIDDYDIDGKPDILISSGWNSLTMVLRNTSNPGHPSFVNALKYNYSLLGNTSSCDLDMDGKPDLAFSLGLILRNTSTRGNISFEIQSSSVSSEYASNCIGDVDGDGKPDLVMLEQVGSRLIVARNTSAPGTISFAPTVEFIALTTPTSIALSDLDGDGRPEMAVTLHDNHFAVLKNLSSPGSIAFALPVNYSPFKFKGNLSVAIGDVNGDGRPDPIVISETKQAISIFINNVSKEPFIQSFTPSNGISGTSILITGGNFTAITSVAFGGVAASSFTVNSPTTISAIVGSGASGTVSVSNADGTGTLPGFVYGILHQITGFSPESGPVGTSTTITGLNFSAVAADNVVFVGGVRAEVTAASAGLLKITVPPGTAFRPITVTTNNRTAYSSGSFVTTFQSGGSVFTPESLSTKAEYSGQGGTMVTMGDLNGDGKPELVHLYQSGFGVLKNTSLGTAISFAPVQSYFTNGGFGSVSIGDIDGDGKPDLVGVNTSGKSITILKNTSNAGIISFASRIDVPTGDATLPQQVTIMDFDGDGKPDIALAGYSSRTLTVLVNRSNNSNILFAPGIDYPVSDYPTDIAASDLDGDGRPDLIASAVAGDNGFVAVFRNISTPGTLAFETRMDFTVGKWPMSVAVGDLDSDGKRDIVVPNVNGGNFSLLKNTSIPGVISFMPKVDFAVNFRPNHISISDMDGDGILDIGIIKQLYNRPTSDTCVFSICRNTSTPGNFVFSEPVNFNTDLFTIKSTIGDLDNDGKPDVAVVRNGNFAILRNQHGETKQLVVCAGGSIKVSSNVSGNTYQWQQDRGTGFAPVINGTNISGATTATLELSNVPVAWNNNSFRCLVNGGTPTSAISRLTVNPTTSANAGPDTSICTNGSGLPIGTVAVIGQTYLWMPATGLSSQTSAVPIAKPGATTTYTLTVSNQHGCTSTSAVTVKVTSTPAIPSISPSGTIAICNDAMVEFTSTASAGNQWYLNNTVISTATSQNYKAAKPGQYALRNVINGCASDLSAVSTLVVTPTPPKPGIFQNGFVLFSSSQVNNQWYWNGVPIQGATKPVYVPLQAGQYTVQIIQNACRSTPSDFINYVSKNDFIIGPNPVTDRLYIRYSGSSPNTPFEILVEEITGKQAVAPYSFSVTHVLNMRSLKPGLYVVRIRNKNTGEHVERMIVKW